MTSLDVPPMPECPVSKSGRHELAAILPGDDEHDLTLFCSWCGSLRRVPASGAIPVPPDHVNVLWSRG